MKIETVIALGGMAVAFLSLIPQLWKFVKDKRKGDAADRAAATRAVADRDSVVISASEAVVRMLQASLLHQQEEELRLRAQVSRLEDKCLQLDQELTLLRREKRYGNEGLPGD